MDGPPSRSTLLALSVATAIAATGLAAGGTAGPLLADHLSGEAAAGLPLGFLVTGAAAGALVISRRSARVGRGPALALGHLVGAAGAIVAAAGGATGRLPVVLAGCVPLGFASAAVFLTRYAAADLAGPGERGRALGTAFLATAIGAVVSPNLLGPGAAVARALGLPELTGMFVIAATAFVIAGLLVAALGDARVPSLGRGAALLRRPAPRALERGEIVAGLRSPGPRIALVALGTTNLVMIAVMTVAPLGLRSHGHGLGTVGFVVSVHVAGMFAPSPVMGWIADRAGAASVAALGALIMMAAGIAATMLDVGDSRTMLLFLATVGVAWSAGIVGASAMLVASVPAAIRPQSEGVGEVVMSLAAAVGALGAGPVLSVGGFGALGIAGAAVAALSLVAIGLGGRVRPSSEAPVPVPRP